MTIAAFTIATILAGWSAEARACKPYIPPPTTLVGPAVPGSALRVTRQGIALECRAEDGVGWRVGVLLCSLRATFEVENPTDAAIVGRGDVLIERGQHVVVRRDGVDISAAASAEEREAWRGEARERGYWQEDPEGELRTFDAAIAAGSAAQWVVEADVTIELSRDGCSMPPIFSRHGVGAPPIFSRFFYLPRLDPRAPLEVELVLPRGYAVDDEWGGVSPRAFTRAAAGRGRRRHRARLADAGEPVSISISREVRFAHGGPIIAAGLGLGAGVRPRLRVGWELATLRRWWIQSLAVESDLRSLSVVPMTEVATRVHLWVIPSLGLGLGAPFRVLPDRRAGVRTQLTLGWPRLALVGAFDVYPARARRSDLRGGLMIQVGL